MPLRVAKVEGIHDHADVGRILAGHAQVRDLDQLEGGLVEVSLKLLIAVEITVGLLDHDVALQQETLQHLLDVEPWKPRITGSKGDVL